MATMARPIKIGLPLALIVALVAALVLFAFGSAGGGSGFTDGSRISGTIEYTVRDAFGAIKAHKIIHNTTTTLYLNAIRDVLGAAGGPAAITTDADLYDNIQVLTADDANREVTPADGDLSINLDANPKDGTNTSPGAGQYETVVTFTASAASTIEELQLTKGSATSGTAETIGAFQNVSITLANLDTLQVTWTITVS